MSEMVTRPSGADGEALPLGDDLMRGADAIRRFMFGEAADERQAEANTRSVYHMASKRQLGLFKLGGVLCGRKSTILAWIQEQERNTRSKVA